MAKVSLDRLVAQLIPFVLAVLAGLLVNSCLPELLPGLRDLVSHSQQHP